MKFKIDRNNVAVRFSWCDTQYFDPTVSITVEWDNEPVSVGDAPRKMTYHAPEVRRDAQAFDSVFDDVGLIETNSHVLRRISLVLGEARVVYHKLASRYTGSIHYDGSTGSPDPDKEI